MAKHALVFGASGITGWAVVNELLSSSADAQVFDQVTALTVRSINAEQAFWPESPKLNIYNGIDLAGLSAEETKLKLQEKVTGIASVTHVFFHTYKWVNDPKEESILNSRMLVNATEAIEALSPNFEFLVLPTGTKAYGIHLVEDFPFRDQLPLSEMLPRVPEPHASQLFYYWETDALERLSKGKQWTWCEVRPDLVVGFVPNNNAHCLAQSIALYLSLYNFVNGKGSKVPWPGTAKSYHVLSSQTNQDILAKFSIWASLNRQISGQGEAFNVIDSNKPSSWAERWSLVCSLFDLEGTGFDASAQNASEFLEEHRADWEKLTAIHGLKAGALDNAVINPFFFNNILSFFDYDHQIACDKMYKAGFTLSMDEKTSWSLAFERFRRAKIIP